MEVYLNGELAEPESGSKVVLTRQANDITKPDNIQADYSNTVRFPKTKANRQRFGFAEEVDSETLVPYRYLEAQMVSEGIEVLPYGKFELKESKEAYEGTLFSGNIRFFDALGARKLTELDFSEFNHLWIRANIIANLQNTSNFFYSLVAIGKDFVAEDVPVSHFYPHTYVKMLWEKIFEQAGFAYEMTAPEMFEREFLPVNFTPKYSKEFMQARSHYGYVPAAFIESGGQSYGRAPIERTVPYIGISPDPYFTGISGNFDTGTFIYTADKAIYVDLAIKAYAYIRSTVGAAYARLALYHNGVEIDSHQIDTTEVEGNLNDLNLSLNIKDLLLNPGDTLETKIKLAGKTAIHRWSFSLYDYAHQINVNTFEVKVKDTFPEGGEIDLVNWLPDMSQKDFVKAMVKQFGWTMQTDPYENLIRLTLFNAVLQNRSIAKDWTAKREFSEDPAVGYTFGEFGQRNLFAWKPDERTPEGYGNGILTIDNETLKPDYEALTMPFAATANYLEYLNVEVWEKQEDSTYRPRKVEPRLALRSDQKIAFGISEDGTTETVEGFKAYFSDASEPYDLDMQRTIIPVFYDTLLAIVNKCKRVRASYLLTAQDIQEFDQSIPVFDADFGQYFYLNIIEQYEEGKPALVHLYRLGDPVNQ